MISREPLSAQAQPPRRPSGADKKQKPAKKEGRQGRSRNRRGSLSRSTPNSVQTAANQHCQTLEVTESSATAIDASLPERRTAVVLDEKCGQPQCQKMVRRGDLTTLPWRAGQSHMASRSEARRNRIANKMKLLADRSRSIHRDRLSFDPHAPAVHWRGRVDAKRRGGVTVSRI